MRPFLLTKCFFPDECVNDLHLRLSPDRPHRQQKGEDHDGHRVEDDEAVVPVQEGGQRDEEYRQREPDGAAERNGPLDDDVISKPEGEVEKNASHVDRRSSCRR